MIVRSRPRRLLPGVRNLLHTLADQLQLKWLDVAPGLTNHARAGLREVVQDRGDGGSVQRERTGLETGVGHRGRPDDRLFRGLQIQRCKPEARIQDLRNVLRGFLEEPQIVLAQRQNDVHRRRLLAQFVAERRLIARRRPHPAGEITQLVQEMRAGLLALQCEQLLELIKDQYRREQAGLPARTRRS